MYFRKLTISMPFAQNTYHILPPPHRRHLARSFPVPRGRTATGGRSTMPSLSMASISQPTVPSPPHTKIRAPGTSLKNCNLKKKNISNFSSVKIPQSISLSKIRKSNSLLTQLCLGIFKMEHNYLRVYNGEKTWGENNSVHINIPAKHTLELVRAWSYHTLGVDSEDTGIFLLICSSKQ